MNDMLYVKIVEAIPKTRNNIQRDCWNQGHKVIPDKKKQKNKRKCRQKNRAIRCYSNSPLSLGRYLFFKFSYSP